MREQHVAESASAPGVEPSGIETAVPGPAEQEPYCLYQPVHLVCADPRQASAVFVEYQTHSPVQRDVDFLVRLLLGEQDEFVSPDPGYLVIILLLILE